MDFRLPARFAISRISARWPMGGPRDTHHASTTSPILDDLSGRLTEMAAQQPRNAAESLAQCVADIRRQPGQLRAQLQALEQVFLRANTVLAGMERTLDESRLPLPSTARIAAATADRLLKQLSEAYVALSAELDSKWLRVIYAGSLELATFRAVQLINRRALLAHRAYAAGSPRRWAVLRKLAMLARQHGFDRKTLDSTNDDTIEHLLIRGALMALADPSTLGSAELGWLRFYVDRHAAKGIVRNSIPEQRGSGLFVLSDSGRGPQRLTSNHKLEPGELLVDLRHVLKKLKRQLVGLRRNMAPNKLGLPVAASEPSYVFMLQRCSEQWSEPRTRRHTRNKFKPRADLIAGYDAARHFLSSIAFRRRSDDPSVGLSIGLAQASEWAILDQSPSGFGLRFVSGQSSPIAVGELIALRPREGAVVHLCVTRRARSVTHADFELGLELLGDGALPVTITKPLGNGKSLPIPALLLPKVPSLNNSPGLLAPIGDVVRGMSLTVPYKGRPVRLEAVEVVETMATCQLMRLRALRADARGETVADELEPATQHLPSEA